MIIETSANEFYRVRETGNPDLAHVWIGIDRKSTRLNSSHTVISYAVFCLKKKKKINSVVSRNDCRNALLASLIFLRGLFVPKACSNRSPSFLVTRTSVNDFTCSS